MASLSEYRNERLHKLESLKGLGINPYPSNVKRTHKNAEVLDKFDNLAGQEITVVGRIRRVRSFGKLAFIVIKDHSGEVQLYIKDDTLQGLDAANNQIGIEQLNLLDSGDFVQATGETVTTKTGEQSLLVRQLIFLGKSLRPLPLSHEEFTNKEERLRRRYVDINVNDEVRQRYLRRSQFWQANRDFLNAKEFYEVNIPVLEHTTGGADAKPFKTHMDALDQDFYLRISHELPLKRLIGAGYERVYDIGPRFRNEHYTEEHLPEHVAMEWYWAYADWRDGQNLMRDLLREVLQKVYARSKFTIHDHEVDLANDWPDIDYAQIIQEKYGLDIFNCSVEDVKNKLAEHQLEVADTDNKSRGIDKLWKNLRKDIAGPAWLINTPAFISPLAKSNPDRPETTQRFQLVLGGTELGNGYSELNDPLDQLERFKQQQAMRDAGDPEAQMLDIDYVEMLEYGMPPTCGWGHSERVFWLFEGVTAREGVPFPQMKHEVDGVTRSIYPDVNFDNS